MCDRCFEIPVAAADKVSNVMNVQTVAHNQVRYREPAVRASMSIGSPKTSVTQLDILLIWRDRVGLFKRSGPCSSVSMPWQLLSTTQSDSCSTDDGLLQCIHLLHGGTGLTVRDILTIRSGPIVELSHGSQCTAHLVHVVETNHRRLTLGPGYSTYRWVKRPKVGRFDGHIDWLGPVLDAVASRPLQPLRAEQADETPEGRAG